MPVYVKKFEALTNRLSVSHPKRARILDQLIKHQSGVRGENSLNYFYRYLPSKDIILLHHVRILHMGYFFQMDTLLLSPHFCCILEIKNYSGHLYFDEEFGQLIRTIDNKREVFDCPILQVQRQEFHLEKILTEHKLPQIPIESLVIITNPKAEIAISPNHIEAKRKVIKSAALKKKIEGFYQKHGKEDYSIKMIKKLMRVLKKADEPYDPNILELYGIDQNELIKGVLCPNCKYQPMVYLHAKWECLCCGTKSKNGHVQALRDYALIISTTITNKECKDFLNLTTSKQAYHLLKSLNLPYTGENKARYYHLDSLLDDE
jgi:hypothetical protein